MWHRDPPLPVELREHLANLGARAEASIRERGSDPCKDSQGRWRRTWRFPTDDAAEHWNDDWDEVLARRESMHPAFTRLCSGTGADVFLDALARLCGAILAEEVHAGTPCPYMTQGWGYAVAFEHILHADTSVELPQPLVMKLSGQVLGPDGDVHWTADATRIYPAELVPRTLVALWSLQPFPEVEENYA
jgi:hypothetical protein